MGLDMHLTMREYRYIHEEPQRTQLCESMGLYPFSDNGGIIVKVDQEVVYWRKANAIHQWFVINVQNGKDDCGSYDVDIDDLKTLKAACEAVLDDRHLASRLLPTAEGVFFGSTAYDEQYLEDLQNTVIQITDILAHCAAYRIRTGTEPCFSYQSSW